MIVKDNELLQKRGVEILMNPSNKLRILLPECDHPRVDRLGDVLVESMRRILKDLKPFDRDVMLLGDFFEIMFIKTLFLVSD